MLYKYVSKFRLALFGWLLLSILASTSGALPSRASAPALNLSETLVDDSVFLTAEPGFYAAEIQIILELHQHPLANYQEIIDGEPYSAAELLWNASQTEIYGLNPKILLTFVWSDPTLFQSGDLRQAIQTFAFQLWSDYYAFENGQVTLSLDGGDEVPCANRASCAILQALSMNEESHAQLTSKASEWVELYHQLFAANPTESLILAPAALAPFLRLPFNHPANGFFTINSFFDHDYPGDNGDYTLRFDGKNLSGNFRGCLLSYSCYSGHNAIDYNLPLGTSVYAAASGTVVLRDNTEGGLIIDHGNGYRTIYWHMNEIYVSVGEYVTSGERIGKSGNKGEGTGAHLHFGVRRVDGSKNLDPFGWWSSDKDPWGSSHWFWRGDLVADNRESQAQLLFRNYWTRDAAGFQGESWYTLGTNNSSESRNWAIWGTFIEDAGEYEVFAYWPRRSSNTTSAKFRVFHAGGSTVVTVDQRNLGDDWVSLGTFTFDGQRQAVVILTDQTGDDGQRVYFDAIKWEMANQLNTTATLLGDLGENGWYTSTVTAILTATNAGASGVTQVEYMLDQGEWQTQPGDTATMTVDTDGAHMLYYHAQDTNGRWEVVKEIAFAIDTTAPILDSLVINNGQPYVFTVFTRLTLAASDATSGIDMVRLRTANSTEWGVWQSWFDIVEWWLPPETGVNHTVLGQVRDLAGNISVTKQDSILLNIYPDRPASPNYQLARSVLGASGLNAGSLNYQVNSTFGQLAVPGASSSSDYQLISGYWLPMSISDGVIYTAFLPVVQR